MHGHYSQSRRYACIEIVTSKDVEWNEAVTLTFFDENYIYVRNYDGDGTERELMGSGKL